MDRHPKLSKGAITKLADAADLVWICGVFDSGYHNGAKCKPHNQYHDPSWRCGWYWRATIPASKRVVS